jgi:predicted outer membrane repeat protein
LCALATAATAGAGIVYVNAAAPPNGDGMTWSTALRELRDGLAAAEPGDEIWVAAGTYAPAPPGGDRNVSFALKSGVSIYGGFLGDETSLEQRDPFFNVTTLTGDLSGDDQPDFANRADNSYQVVTAVDVANLRLDGLTINGGYADGPGFGATPASRDQGSGLNVYYSTPLIVGCRFVDNWSANHGALNDHGTCTLIDCAFESNHSEHFGAGLYIHHDAQTLADGCDFRFNTAVGEGAGAYSRAMHGAMIMNCSFFGNEADHGAAFYHAEDSATHVESCTFAENTGVTAGGGIFGERASPTIVDCTFIENFAGIGVQGGDGGGGGSGGGAIWFTGGTATVRDCRFFRNMASFGGACYNIEGAVATYENCLLSGNEAHEAGGIYSLTADAIVQNCRFIANEAHSGDFSVGGGLSNYYSSTFVADCYFERNSAELGGGGLYSEGAAPRVLNCTFVGNQTTGEAQGRGGGVMNGYFTQAAYANCVFSGNHANLGGGAGNFAFSEARFINCSFASNTAALDGGGVHFGNLHESSLVNCALGGDAPNEIAGEPGTVSFSCLPGGYPGTGNADAAPAFVNALGVDGAAGTEDDDLRLATASPCIDAGDSTALVEWIAADADRLPRRIDDPSVADTGVGPPVVDIGAYEHRPSGGCFGDFNGDGAVGLADLAILLSHFGAGDADPNDGDLDLDGDVDIQDLGWLLAVFGRSCD